MDNLTENLDMHQPLREGILKIILTYYLSSVGHDKLKHKHWKLWKLCYK